MTTFHTDPNAGLPAPSDIELIVADNLRYTVQVHQGITFNQFAAILARRDISCTFCRWDWFYYAVECSYDGQASLDQWWKWWHEFTAEKDERDQADTLADSLQ